MPTTAADAAAAAAAAAADAAADAAGVVAADLGVAAAAADLLAHWWSRPVEAEVEAWIGAAAVQADVRGRLAAVGGGQPGPSLECSIDQVPELLEEYERLFVGPGQLPCPPYESCWRDDVPIDLWHSLMGPCTAEVRELYHELGVDVSPEDGELPDHVAVEFEALACALAHPEGGVVADKLVRAHLGRWLPRLCKQVEAEASHPFYRRLAVLTADWIERIKCLVPAPGGAESGAGAGGEAGSGAPAPVPARGEAGSGAPVLAAESG